jgi:hypothetical protein
MSYDPAHLETLFEPREFDTSPLSVDHDPLEPSRCPYVPPEEEPVSPLESALPNMDPQEGHPPSPINRDPVSPFDPAFYRTTMPVYRTHCPDAPPDGELVSMSGPASGSNVAGGPSATDGCVTDKAPNSSREGVDRLRGSEKIRRRLQQLREWLRKRVSKKS